MGCDMGTGWAAGLRAVGAAKTNDQYEGGVVPAISKKGRKAIHIIIVTHNNKNVNRKLEKSVDKLKYM